MSKSHSTNIVDVDFQQALSERYLAYSLSTIMSRSLPDVRDGLKPVHRRLLYAMYQLNLIPKNSFKKCARVVGDVMGKFHPHGDSAIYGALVRLAQDFSSRYPLISGQGNFGNIDGDNAAAMRYTEARLSEIATLLLEGITEETVNFRATYDGEQEEPIVFPAIFPNLLANGATGIAVGMATNIPPHNLEELIDSLVHLIANPTASIADLLQFVKGPDFPTGSEIIETPEHLLNIYTTGKGSIRMRAVWAKEEKSHGMYQIVVKEIPFQVEKADLVMKISQLIDDKKLPLLENVVDESAEDIRLVLEPKNRQVDPQVLMEQLFRLTDLETRFAVNMNVLDADQTPRVMSLKELLQAFLNHSQEVLVRKSNYQLQEIVHRLEVLGGLLVAYLNLDRVIYIIREEDNPAQVLQQEFNLTEIQVEAILNMRLRSLRKLQEIAIRQEAEELTKQQKILQKLLDSNALQMQAIKKQLEKIKEKFGKQTAIGVRRTKISYDLPNIIIPEIVNLSPAEDVTIILSDKLWLRCLKGHNLTDIKYKDGDQEKFIIQCNSHDKLLIFSDNGRFYTINIDKLPRSRNHQGESLRFLINLEVNDNVVNIFNVSTDSTDKLLLAAEDGKGFIVDVAEVIAHTKQGKHILKMDAPNKGFACLKVNGDIVAIVGKNRKLLIFNIDEIPQLARGRGVILQRYRDEGMISAIKIFNRNEGISWHRNNKLHNLKEYKLWIGKRGSSGRLAPIGFPRNNKFIDL